MRKSSKARLFSTCLTGAILAAAAPAWGQTSDAPTWKPRAEVDAQVGKDIGVSTSLFAPIAQNDSSLVYVDGRIGYDQRFDRNGSATIGARVRVGEDVAIGVNAGADFYRSDIGSRDQAAVSMGLEGFTSVFDVRVNYRLPLSKIQTIGYIDPAATSSAALVLENNRLIERHSGFRLEAIPLQGFNGEAGVRLPVGSNASIRGSVGGFDYWDKDADRNYRGIRGGLEMDIEDRNSGARFTFGGTVEHDNRFGTDARATVRLSVPFGGRSGDRGAVPTGLDRQMGDRVRRDYVARSGSRYRDLTSSRFAVDARTGNEFGGFYYASGTGVAGAAGTLATPTTISDAVTRAGANGVVVALGSGGNIATPGVTLATNQYLLGGAGAVDVRLLNGGTAQFALGGTNGVIVGSNAAGATVTLGQGSVVRDLTIRGAGTGIAANGVGGFAIDRVIVENTGGAGISLTNTLGSVALTGLTVRGGAGAGVLVNGGSSVSLANSTISGGAGAVDINDGGANLAVSLAGLTLSATGGNVLDIDGSGAGTVTVTGLSGITIRGGTGETGGLSVRSATFDANTTTAGIQTVNAGRMEVGTTAARVNGQGVFLTDVIGSLSFTDLDIANSGATGLHVVNSKVNSFTLATLDGTIDTVGGTAADLDPLVIDLNFASISSVGAAGPGVILNTVQGGGTGGNALTIGTLTISNSGGDGLVILNSTGLVRVNGGAITNSGGSSVRIGTQGVAGSGGSTNLAFGASITDPTGTAAIVAIFNTSGTLNFTGAISGRGPILVQDTLAGSAITFGAITLTGTAGNAITLGNLAGSINFAGLVTIANPGANGIVIGNVPGGVTFGNVDITGLGNFTGLDVTGAHGNVLFTTLDITGTGGGKGIDVTGSTNAGNVIVLNGSIIQGVNIGVDLTQANMTGQFRFGDGNPVPLNSTIAANIPIVIALMNASNGSYNFADANLVGDTSNLTGAGFTAYYARVGATGAGTRSDPGSLAGADASAAQYIVLLNNPAGGQDVFDAASAGGSFDLAAGQSLVSFLNGDFIAVSGAGLPANLIVSGIGPAGITNVYAGSGGAVLTTTTAGSATVNLSNNSRIDGLVIRNAGNDVGVEGVGVGGVTIANSDIGGSAGAIAISDGGAAASVTLMHLDLSSSAGTTLSLSGAGAGTLTVSASDVDIAATGASAAASLTDLSSGGIAFGTISTGISAGSALTVQGVTGGSVAIGSVAVGGTGAGAGVAISGNSAAVSIGAVSVAGSAGDAVQIANNSGAVSVGALSSSGAAGAGLNLQNILGNVTVGSASISGGVSGVSINGVGTGGAVTIAGLAVTGSGTGVTLADVDGSVSFTGTTSIANPGTSGIVIGAGSAGTISFGDVDITGLGAGTTGVDARNASGTVKFNTLDITGSSTAGTRGIDLTNATFGTSFTTTQSGSITGVGIGVDLTDAAITGSFRYGDGSNTDADGAASSINAVTPIVITGINVGAGNYNFLDVALTGDTSTLTTSATLYFVKAGATGVGTIADPGSLAGAEASAADTIILLNDPTGGQDILDAAGAGGSFDLTAGRTLLSFLNGDTLMLPGGAPANLLLFGIPSGQIGNPFAGSGAPVLTTTMAGANTVTLGGSTTIDGVIIQTGAGGGAGVFGSGVANVVIRNSNISGEGGAIHLIDNGAAASVALSNLTLSSTGGIVAFLDGTGGGTLAVTQLNGITIQGGNGETDGFYADGVLFDADLATAGAQAVIGSMTIGAAGARVDGTGLVVSASDGSLDFVSLDVANANNVGVVLNGNLGLTAIVRAGSIDTLGDDALVGVHAALTLDFGSIVATGGGIFMIDTSAATTGEPVLNVATLNLTDGGLFLAASGDYVFTNASITDSAGIAVFLADSANLDYSGDITSNAGAVITLGFQSHTGTASFHDGTIDVTDGAGIQFVDADGTYSFTGTTTLHGGDAGINIASGSSGSFFFGADTSVTNGAIANFLLQNSDANVTYLGSLTQGLNTDNVTIFGQTGGVVDFSQATISASAGSGLRFLGADGTSMLGDVQLSGGAGIEITGSGAISFDNVDITGVGANQTAVDLTGALGNVTFLTLDIAGASTVGSKGIDLSGSTTAANITVIESSSITGVGIGVDLTNAAITGNFRYGDGSNTDADGAASTISAGVPIEITGLNGATGTYDFADVNLIGDTSRLTTSATTYFVADGAAGVGTMADPGSLAGAEASGAQFIILLNDPSGGSDTLDAASAGGSFDLAAGQSLLGFLNGDTLTLPGGGPANLVLFGLTPGQIVNPFAASGAPVLTNSTGADTLILASNTLVDGILINAPNGRGIFASDAANVTIRNSNISAGSNAIMLVDGAAGTSASLRNLQLAANSGAVLELDGTGLGALTLTALDQITIAGGNGELFGIYGSGVTFDADLTTAGFQTVSGTLDIGSVGSRVTSTGIFLIDTEGAAAFDMDVATDGGSGVLVQGTPGALRFDITGGTIDALNSTGYGLYLANASADVVLASITYAGAGTAVSTQNVTGAGPLGRAIDVATLTVADGAASAIAMSGSAAGSFSFGVGSSIGTTTGAAISLSNTGASTFNYAGSVNYAGVDAILSVSGGHSGTVNFTGAIDATSGTGLVFDDADGTYNFTGSANMAAGIGIFNGSAGSFAFGADTTIVSPGGIAVDIQDSTASVGYAGTITYGSAGLAAINVVNHSGGTIDFTGLIDITTGTGINFDNADGTYNFTGTTGLDAGSAGIVIANGSAGDFTFGANTTVIVNGGSALAVSSSTATIDYLGYAYALAGNGISITDHSVGTIDFSGATLDLNGGTTVRFDNADGTYSFGSFAAADGSGIAILNGSAGGFTFGDIDIADLSAGQTAVDLTGATGNVTFQTLDITGTGGTGIDLSGSTTAADIIINESSTISGVGVGVDLTNAAITGNFRYGDGSSTDADGAASSINAVTPLVIAGLNPGGTYDFADVVLTGDTSTLQTNKTVFWVQAGATGAGTRTDPGSLAAAEASGVDVIILLDAAGAGQDVIDGATAGGGLDLAANQSLLSFLNGDTLSIGGGAPANLLLYGIVGGSVTNPYAGSGAPLLTTSQAGATTVNLASGALIDGVQIGNLDWKGVYGGYLTDVTIRNSVIFGGVNAIEIVGNGGSAALSNLDLSSATGDVLRLRGDGGDLFVTQLANLTIHGGNSGRGLFGEQLVFDASVATAGIQRVVGVLNIGSSASRVGGAGLVLDDVTGALELATNVYNTDGDGIFADGGAGGFTFAITGGTIDTGLVTTAGSALNLANLSADLQLDSVTYSGLDSGVLVNNVTGVGIGGRALDIDTLTVASGAASGISLLGTTSGNFSFGSASAITGTTVAGIAIANSGAGTFNYAGNITGITTGALVSVSNGDIGNAVFSGTLSATGGIGLQFDNADGFYTFGGTTTLNGGDAGIDIVNGSGGSFLFEPGASIISPSGIGMNIQGSTADVHYRGSITFATAGQAALNVSDHSGGTIMLTGALNVTNGTGLQFNNADGAYHFSGSTLNGGDAGIDIVNGSGGEFIFGGGFSITSPSGIGINVADSTAKVSYWGSLTYATVGTAAISVLNHSTGTISIGSGGSSFNVSGGTGLQFDNADGTYEFVSTTTLNGGDAGIDIVNGSAGIFTFGSGTSITSPSGVGIDIQNSTAAVTYSGNLTYATAGQAAVHVSAQAAGSLNLQTATLNVSGGIGLSFDNADGTYQFGSLALSGGAGIAVLNGSAGGFTFGDVDVTGLGANQTAINLTGATGMVTFNTLDITGTSAVGSKGIDLTGNTGAGDIVVTNSSTITGVGVGVDLTNASRTGLFQYGDGESAIDVASTITATTPLVITGLNGGTGTYNFADVNLVGDTSALATTATVYYVLAGASGAGTLGDPGSLAGAEAAAVDIIILLNNPTGGQDVLDAAGTNGNDTLALDVSQILRSFRDSNTITLPGGAPANVILTGVTTGQVVNPYAASALTATDRAPILTTTGADNTVTLANNSLVDGVFVQGVNGSAAVFGSGRSGVTISNATISGPGHGLLLLDGGAAASATLTNLTVSSSGSGTALGLAGNGAGTLTVAGSGINVSQSGLGALIAIDDIVVGGANLSFGTVASTTSAAGVDLDSVTGLGTLSFGSITVAGASGSAVALHDSSATVNLGNVTVSGALGTGIALTANSGAITIGTVDISSSAIGIGASGLTSTLTVGDGTIDGATTAGILIGAGNTVLLDFGNIDITALQTGARGVDARLTGGSNVFFETLGISGASATGTRGIDLTGNTGLGNFTVNESSTITGVGIGVDLTNASRTGGFRYGDGSNIDFDLAASTINAATPIVIAGLNGATGTYDFRDVTLVGDTSPLEVSAFFVRAGATGVGSRSDPGSLAAADASTASFIVLLDTQAGAGSFDTISGTLTLANNQSLLSFRDTDTFNVGGGAPPNVFVFNVTTGTITNPNSGSGAPLLTSADATGTVQLGGTSVIDGVVVSNTGTGAGIFANGTAGIATIRNSTISGGGAAVDIRSGALVRAVNLQNLTLANAGNQAGALLNLNGTGGTLTVTGMSNLSIGAAGGETAGLVFDTVTFDSDLATGGIQAVNAGALTIGTTGARVQGDGLSLTNVSGSLTFSDLDIANTGGTGLLVANSKANSFLLTTADGSYDTTFGTAVNLDPLTVNMTVSSVTATNGAYGIQLDQVEGFFTVTGAVNVTNATIAGIAVENNTGQADALDATFNGAVTINNTVGAGLSLTNNAGATIIFAGGGTGVDVVTTGGAALNASGGTLSIAGSGNSLTSGTGQTMALSGLTVGAPGINFGSVSANGAATAVVLTSVTATGGGAINLGTVNLQGITSRGIDVNTALGAALSITDLDIGLNSTTAVAVDLNGAALTASVTANDFDVTNAAAAGTSIAVDLRGTTGGQVVRLGDSVAGGAAATIAGVNTGVWLDGTTNAAFTYGDGEAAIDSASTISAVTGINAAAAPAIGTYNFTDVTFGASPGLGFGIGRTWFVDSNGAIGGGNGSGADGANPMTLAAAEFALAATDVIVLINNGSAISAAGSNANDTLNLIANTQVRGFGQGPLALTLVVPSTILLSSSTINIADPTAGGAATLTSAAGANVITLGASGNRISGFILDGAPAGALRGVVDAAGATGTVIDFMTIRNFNQASGYGIEITPSTNTTIDNVTFTGNTNDVLLNAAGSTITNVTATGATGTSITLDNATGTTTLTNVAISGAATGLSFTNAGGTINAANVDIGGAATSALTIGGGTASFNFDGASSIVQAAGGLTLNVANHSTGTLAFAGLINATSGSGMQFNNADGTYNFTGITTLNGGNAGIDIYNGATGTFTFGSATNLTHNGAGNAFTLLSSANVTFDGSITDNDGVAVEIDAHDAGTATFNGAITSSIANASTVISIINSNGGAINFNGAMNIASTGTAVNLSANQGSTITFNAGGSGLDITGTTNTAMIITGGGTVNVQGSGNSITTTTGTLLSVTDTGGTATAVDLSFASAANTSGANGIVVQRVGAGTITGTVNIASGAITATTRGVSLTGDALNFTYGGTIATSGAASRSFEATARTGGTAALSGNITDTSLGISIANNTGGTINLTGQTISLNTGANTAVTLSSNSGATINFAPLAGGNGLDIVTTSGAGFSATGGGTVTVTGTGNSIQTATGQVINLTGVSAGASGINFASLQSTGIVASIAINLNNLDSVGGGAFSGGTTSVAATSGGNDGIFIGNGSAANISFGATTIGTGTISGDGIEINGSGNGTVTFTSVDIDNTTAHGVSIVGAAGVTGAIAINGGTIGAGGAGSITGDGVNVTSGSGTVTVAASIAKTNAGNVVEVSSHTGGAVTFSGNLSATGGAANGILLSNNSGGTIAFSGATKTLTTGANNAIQFDNNAATGAAVSFTGGNLAITTTTGRGVTGTSTTAGAGSLTIQGTNNTITSVGGIALNLVNTNIAAGGLNFLSVSANGGARGIVLNTTGGAAGLTISGTGTTDGSGGTIQNITARGIELLNTALVNISNLNLTNASTTGQAAGQDLDLTTANGAIYMSGVATAVFENINITGTIADNGITGINVSNFQLNNSLITGAGDGAHESGIEFSNLSGTSSLTNTEIALSETNSLDIVNTDVNLNLTLNNVIFRDTQTSGIGEGGFQFRSFSSAAGTPTTNIDIIDSDFLRIRTQGIQVIAEDDSVVSVDITNSVIDSQTGIGAGIDINGNDTSTVRFNIIGNPTIRSSGGAAINITSFISANVMGRIANNANINVYSQTPAGTGASGSGVRLLAQENSHLTVAVTGNTLTQGAGNNSAAVDVIAREGSARLDLTLTGNVIDSTDVNTLADINLQSGSSSGTNIETNQIYANIANNNLTATAALNLLRLRVSELDNTHDPRIFLQGFVEGGPGIEDDAVTTWNGNGNTPNNATAANIAVSLTGTATGPSAGTAQTPTNPLP
nr:hypothetical protein [uncultured Sphingomonas sp.]